MEIKGKYKKSETEYLDCVLSIENGIVHRVIVNDVKPIEYFSINPKENAEFKYYKLPSKKGLVPIESNYKLQYNNDSGNTNTVYLNLSKWDLFKIKKQKKEFYLLKNDNWIKYLMGIVTAIILYYMKDILFNN